MSSAITTTAPAAGADTEERNRLVRQLILKNASDDQLRLVLAICDRYGFDPLLRHIALIAGSLYVTRDGLLHVAHASGQLDGIEVTAEQDGEGCWAATVKVYRKDMAHPFVYTAYQKEHQNPASPAWRNSPRAMTVKCFDERTEVLTTRGFERFDTVEGKVLQVTGHGLEPTEAIPFVQAYDGQMVTLESDDFNFCVTPNHDMVTTNGKVEAGEMYEQARSRSVHRIPRLVQGSSPGLSISNQAIELAAAFLADGSGTSVTAFAISVSRPKKVERLLALGGWHSHGMLPKAGLMAHIGTRSIVTQHDQHRFLYARSLVSPLCGPNKTIRLDALLQLSREQARRFVDAWIFFDGSVHNGVPRFYTSRPDHLAAFELAAVVAGYSVSNRKQRISDIGAPPNYCVNISSRDEIAVRREGRPYKDKPGRQTVQGIHLRQNTSGRVWCVTVPSGVIVVRRHGFSMLCGNCAEVMALRRAFDVSLTAAEEVGYDAATRRSRLGPAMVVEAAPSAGDEAADAARRAAVRAWIAAGKLTLADANRAARAAHGRPLRDLSPAEFAAVHATIEARYVRRDAADGDEALAATFRDTPAA